MLETKIIMLKQDRHLFLFHFGSPGLNGGSYPWRLQGSSRLLDHCFVIHRMWLLCSYSKMAARAPAIMSAFQTAEWRKGQRRDKGHMPVVSLKWFMLPWLFHLTLSFAFHWPEFSDSFSYHLELVAANYWKLFVLSGYVSK